MGDIIVVLIIVASISGAIAKIISEKKKGVKCIGCPHSGTKNVPGGGCSCNHE